MQDDQRVPACQGHPQLGNSRSHLPGSALVPGKRKRFVTLVPWLRGWGDLPPVSHGNHRNHCPLFPPRPPPLFTDGAETIRLKTEGKSRAVGHNHPGLGGRPLQPWGCGTAHGAHATSPVVLTGRGRWLQERGEEGKARRPGWQLRSEEGLGARVQPRQGPGQLPARLQLPPVPLWPLVCASASHTCLGDSSHLPPCTGGQRLERSW